MPFDEKTGQRIFKAIKRELAGSDSAIQDKRMFGGFAVMVNGHMCCGVVGQDLMIRVAANEYEEVLALPHARPMDFTGRPMRGFIYVEPTGFASDAQLRKWIQRSLNFVLTLPPK